MSYRVGIMGVRGCAGEELFRLLLNHPDVEVCCVQDRVEKPQKLSEFLPAFAKRTELVCKDCAPEEMGEACDAVFLALPHTVSMTVASAILAKKKKLIDLSADFRLKDLPVYERTYKTKHLHPELLQEAVYGLPELFREKIRKGTLIANPGCYPTAVMLGAAPFLLKKKPSGGVFFCRCEKRGDRCRAGRQCTTHI
ncbi:MAG: hypothetical protein ABH845_02190 [Candidatus Omnitrophota bacterium]